MFDISSSSSSVATENLQRVEKLITFDNLFNEYRSWWILKGWLLSRMSSNKIEQFISETRFDVDGWQFVNVVEVIEYSYQPDFSVKAQYAKWESV